jgi:hypothetical protein
VNLAKNHLFQRLLQIKHTNIEKSNSSDDELIKTEVFHNVFNNSIELTLKSLESTLTGSGNYEIKVLKLHDLSNNCAEIDFISLPSYKLITDKLIVVNIDSSLDENVYCENKNNGYYFYSSKCIITFNKSVYIDNIKYSIFQFGHTSAYDVEATETDID